MRVEIDIQDGISPEVALEAVKQVIQAGKISNDTKGSLYYCWATTFETSEGYIGVFTREHRKNDCFRVQKITL